MASAASVEIVRLAVETINDPESTAWGEARAQVMRALEGHGCFEIIYDGITPEIQESAMNAIKEVFSLPVEAKRKSKPASGSRGYSEKDAGFLPYESLAIDDVLRPNAASEFSNLMWPEGNITFSESIIRFSEAVAVVEAAVRKMVLEGLGVEKYFDSHMGFTKYLLRLSEYFPQGQNGDVKLALPPHSDATFSGLSLQSDVNGFEMKTRNGDWIAVSPSSPSSLLFINGDLFRAWSNGRLYAPPHRVMMREGETRRVAILFAVPKGNDVIEAPPELVDEEKNPAQFKPFRFLEYRKFFSASVQYAADDPSSVLPAFCGIGAS